ncbi:hypothetical protein, partial [Solihabitans fulvus]|uniref:hypothetical protein n=1 Tax=Solihabitans fulvus TaxID=1892852 RepID=UPI001CB75D71
SRVDQVAEHVTARVTAATAAAGGSVPAETVRGIVREAVDHVRRPPPAPPTPPAPAAPGLVDPVVTAGREAAAQLWRAWWQLGQFALEITPGHWSDQRAADVLFVFAEDIGEDLDTVLACRRYALTGDRRALAEIA